MQLIYKRGADKIIAHEISFEINQHVEEFVTFK